MLQIAYHSRNCLLPDGKMIDGVRSILSEARSRNAAASLTGYLLVDETWFLQILEGEEDRVRATYDRIRRDRRHADVTLIAERTLRGRSFPEWSMGETVRTPDNETIFLRHGIGPDFDPRLLTAPSIVALAMDLQDQRRAKRAARREQAEAPALSG